MNQQYILNKVSLYRNTHKLTYLSVGKHVMTIGSQELNPVFPVGAMVQHFSVHGDFIEYNIHK